MSRELTVPEQQIGYVRTALVHNKREDTQSQENVLLETISSVFLELGIHNWLPVTCYLFHTLLSRDLMVPGLETEQSEKAVFIIMLYKSQEKLSELLLSEFLWTSHMLFKT